MDTSYEDGQLVHEELFYWFQFVKIRMAAKHETRKLVENLCRLTRQADDLQNDRLNSLLRRITEMFLLLRRQIYVLDALINDLAEVLGLPPLNEGQ